MTLTKLLADPSLAATLSPQERNQVLLQVAGLLIAIGAASTKTNSLTNGDAELIDVDTAAALLGVDRSYIWRKSRRLDWQPFTVHVSRKVLRLRRAGLEAWVAARGGGR